MKIQLLICAMLLSPPSIREIESKDRIKFVLPNGFGINNITVSVLKGQEENGRKVARVLLDALHREKTYYLNDGEIEVTLKASTPAEELAEIIHFSNVLNIQSCIMSIDKSL